MNTEKRVRPLIGMATRTITSTQTRKARQGAHWHGDSHDHGPPHAHGHSGGAHGHTHGAVDPTILTTARGIRAIKWSFVGLFGAALFQVVVVWLSGSVALLADTIHNFGDEIGRA